MFRLGKLRIVGLTVLLGVTFAACGGGSGSTSPNSTFTTAATQTTSPDPRGDQALKTAVTEYSNAYLAGKGLAAFDLLSARCQRSIGEAQIITLASGAQRLYGDLPITALTVISNDGTKATVTYTYVVTTLNQSNQPWVFEGGGWKYDNC